MSGAQAMPEVIGLVADDVTGAADAAGLFAAAGWSVRLLVGDEDPAPIGRVPGDAVVFATVTGARPLAADDAAARTEAQVARLRRAGAERLILKIDSTIRGSVAAQVGGAVAAWTVDVPRARPLICPALPAQGRTVHGGTVLVHGEPVTRTPSGRDPFTPVLSSRLLDLFPHAVPLGPSTDVALAGAVADAVSDADLDALAAVVASDPAIVAVGSSGLAGALARRWARSPHPLDARARRVVVAVSSLHPVSRAQIVALRAAFPDIAIVETDVAGDGHPVDTARLFAGETVRAVRATGADALVAVGGDGVAEILRDLRADAVDVDGILADGCPTGTVAGGPHAGLRIVTKSGGFGAPDTLTALVRTLLSPTPATTTKEEHHV